MQTRTELGARRRNPALAVAVACTVLLVTPAGLSAEGWCDLVFKDVIDEAEIVIVAGYAQSGKTLPRITVQDVLKGSCTDRDLDLDLEELAAFRLKNGDQLVVALTSYHQPVRVVNGMGGCTAVSILPIRGGKLRAKDRLNYDFLSKSITLEALKTELLALLHPAS